MPIAATTSPNSTELRKHTLEIAIAQKKIFRDQVVDAETGRPVNFTQEEQRVIDTSEASEQADEQAFLDWFNILEDNPVPSKAIYPDGESAQTAGLPMPQPISDDHVGADGRVTRESGRAFGVFRAGAFGAGKDEGPVVTTFDKFGEAFGFEDRPLRIHDVSYPEPAGPDAPLNRSNETAGNGTANATDYTPLPLCSGKPCAAYGAVGGDTVYDLAAGRPVQTNVGPGSETDWDLDRQVDARTGEERPGCMRGIRGCEEQPGINLNDIVHDEYGEPPGGVGGMGVGAVGAAVPASDPRAPPPRERTIWDLDGRLHGDERTEAPAPYYTRYPKGDTIDNEPGPAEPVWRGSWTKRWDTGSWLAFVLIGPVLTTGIASFVYFTRGPALSLLVIGLLTLLDALIFYFG